MGTPWAGLPQRYAEAVDAVLRGIRETQGEALEKAAGAITDAVLHGRSCHLYDTGHMLTSELMGRAGGLLLFAPIEVRLEVHHQARPRLEAAAKPRVNWDEVEGLARTVLSQSQCVPGDVLVLGSVSGVSRLAVDMALEARRMGLVLVALTSVRCSRALASDHPSGKRVHEVADIVLDHGTPLGDAAVPVDALGLAIGPVSGIAAAYLMWSLEALIVERLVASGHTPSILVSVHLPGSRERNAATRKRFAELGY